MHKPETSALSGGIDEKLRSSSPLPGRDAPLSSGPTAGRETVEGRRVSDRHLSLTVNRFHHRDVVSSEDYAASILIDYWRLICLLFCDLQMFQSLLN